MKNYLIGRTMCFKVLLDWTDQQGDSEIMIDQLGHAIEHLCLNRNTTFRLSFGRF